MRFWGIHLCLRVILASGQATILNDEFGNNTIKITSTSLRGQQVNGRYTEIKYVGQCDEGLKMKSNCCLVNIQCSAIITRYNMSWCYNMAITAAKHHSDFELTKDTPYLALRGEIWGICCEHYADNWLRYNGITLYCYFERPRRLYTLKGSTMWLKVFRTKANVPLTNLYGHI